jgi:hypothetical protein
MDITELTKWVVNRGDDLYSISTQVQFKQKLQKYFEEQLRIGGVVKSFYCRDRDIKNCNKQCELCKHVESKSQ